MNVPVASLGPPTFGSPGVPSIVHLTVVVPTGNWDPEGGLQAPGVAPGNALGVFHLTTAPEGEVDG
ncbi:MAG TPA: hypothetical protein VKW77_02055, partial [Acidimicrobiales bacterium]|nr:hypothetical protein [Acidimicrobiales bacterium]